MEFTVEACSGRTGWDVEPVGELDIDLDRLAGLLKDVKVDTPHVLIATVNGGEVSVYPDGSMFVKEVEGREQARAVVEAVAELIRSS